MNAIQARMAALTRPTNGEGQSAASWVQRARAVVTPLNLHFAGVAALVLVNLYLLVHLGLAWDTAHRQDADAMAQQRVQLKTAQIAALPLQGLDGKLTRSTEQADGFYQKRLPYAESQVLRELGALAKQKNVRLQGVQYLHSPVVEDPSLVGLQMDARLSGDYRPLVEFLNALERDKRFFLIDGVGLTGQQSGTVNLRLRLTTFLRAPKGEERADAVTAADAAGVGSATGAEEPGTGTPATGTPGTGTARAGATAGGAAR
jgi:type IV pilus assembly protein PilO